MHTYSFTNSILNFKKLSFNLDANMCLDILKGTHDKSLVKTLMEYIISRKLIGWNINFGSVYLELLNVLSWKNNWKKYQIFS